MASSTQITRGFHSNTNVALDISTQYAPWLQPYVEKAKPYIASLAQALDAASPYVNQASVVASKLWEMAKPYHVEEFTPLLLGAYLVLFGGQFPLLLAAVEAFRIVGWEATKNSVLLLHRQYQAAMEASRKDDLVDDNKDGIPDVKQIDAKQLVTRKVAVFLKATDPKAVQEGIQGVTAGVTAVIATLRLQFAQTIALGTSLGDVFTQAAGKVLRPFFEKVIPPEYHKWVDPAIAYACRSIAVTIAWWCQRVISTLHSGVRGAQMLLIAAIKLAKLYNINVNGQALELSPTHPAFPTACTAIGVLGLYWQLARRFALPFPFNILALPLRLLEWLLWYLVCDKK